MPAPDSPIGDNDAESLGRMKIPAPIEFMTVQEFSGFLRIANMTGYRMARRGDIEGAMRVGRLWRLPLSGVKAYLASTGFDPSELTLADFAEYGSADE